MPSWRRHGKRQSSLRTYVGHSALHTADKATKFNVKLPNFESAQERSDMVVFESGIPVTPRAESAKYLGVTVCTNLRWSTNFVHQRVLPFLSHYSPVLFLDLPKKDFHLLYRNLSMVSCVSSIPFDSLINKIFEPQITLCKIFSSYSHAFTSSKNGLIPSRLDVYPSSTVLYLSGSRKL